MLFTDIYFKSNDVSQMYFCIFKCTLMYNKYLSKEFALPKHRLKRRHGLQKAVLDESSQILLSILEKTILTRCKKLVNNKNEQNEDIKLKNFM